MKLFPLVIFLLHYLGLTMRPAHRHPLDPLTPAEIITVADIVKSSRLGPSESVTFHYVGLEEPDKPLMLSCLSNCSHDAPHRYPPRRAFVMARSGKQTHEIYVDLNTKSVVSDRIYEDLGYPPSTIEEQAAASLLPLNYTPFVESVKKRGVQMKDVECEPFGAGWFGEVKQGKRTLVVLCFVGGETVNLYVRPLEGIVMVVDLDAMEIVKQWDRLVVQVPKSAGTDYRWSKQKPPFVPKAKPVKVVQPEGNGLEIDIYAVLCKKI